MQPFDGRPNRHGETTFSDHGRQDVGFERSFSSLDEPTVDGGNRTDINTDPLLGVVEEKHVQGTLVARKRVIEGQNFSRDNLLARILTSKRKKQKK